MATTTAGSDTGVSTTAGLGGCAGRSGRQDSSPADSQPPAPDHRQTVPADVLFDCPTCRHGLAAAGEHSGKTIHCPGCSAAVIVPSRSAAAALRHYQPRDWVSPNGAGQILVANTTNLELTALRQRAHDLETELEQTRRALEAERDQRKQQEHDQPGSQPIEQLVQARATSDGQVTELAELRAQLERALTSAEAARTETAVQRQEVESALRQELTLAGKIREQLERQLVDMSAALTRATEQLAASRVERERLARVPPDRLPLPATSTAPEVGELTELRAELGRAQEESERLRHALNAAESARCDQERRQNEIETGWRQELTVARQTREQLERQVAELSDALTQTTDQLAVIRGDRSRLADELKELRDQMFRPPAPIAMDQVEKLRGPSLSGEWRNVRTALEQLQDGVNRTLSLRWHRMKLLAGSHRLPLLAGLGGLCLGLLLALVLRRDDGGAVRTEPARPAAARQEPTVRPAAPLEPAVQPASSSSRFEQAIELAQEGEYAEAARVYEQLLAENPNQIPVLNNLAFLRATAPDATVRDGAQAVRLAMLADQAMEHKNMGILDTLAAAWAEAGQFQQAITTAKQALALATAREDEGTVARIRANLGLYEMNLPLRAQPPAP